MSTPEHLKQLNLILVLRRIPFLPMNVISMRIPSLIICKRHAREPDSQATCCTKRENERTHSSNLLLSS